MLIEALLEQRWATRGLGLVGCLDPQPVQLQVQRLIIKTYKTSPSLLCQAVLFVLGTAVKSFMSVSQNLGWSDKQH